MFAPVWFSTRVSVDVVLKGSQRLESSIADTALVRTLFWMTLHVPGQKVSKNKIDMNMITDSWIVESQQNYRFGLV